MMLFYQARATVTCTLTTLLLLSQSALADWAFKSRPDLSPPILNITIPATSEVSPGFIFVALHKGIDVDIIEPSGPIQSGSYIFSPGGELVWSGVGCLLDTSSNFHVTRYRGDEVLVAFEANAEWNNHRGVGTIKILNNSYLPIRTIVGNGMAIDVHEFNIQNGKTALVSSYMPVPYDLAPFGMPPESQWIFDTRFQEIDLDTGEVLFDWSSLDHITPDESIEPISTFSYGTGFSSADSVDYLHINSLDKDGKDYLVSGRRTSTIYKVDGASGDIVWRLGGKLSNFTLGPGVEFGLQHHARLISRSKDGHNTKISIFDNSGRHVDGFLGGYENTSSGKILFLDTRTWAATLVQDFPAPAGLFASYTGSTQLLPNGNAFINWGSPGAVSEFTSNGTLVFHAYLDSGELFKNGKEFTYRASRSNWTGIPRDDPSLVASTHEGSILLYVSWNGDTETTSWRFYGVEQGGKEVHLGTEVRSGFETSFNLAAKQRFPSFRADAFGIDGKFLRGSKVAQPKEQIIPYIPGQGSSIVGNDAAQGILLREDEKL